MSKCACSNISDSIGRSSSSSSTGVCVAEAVNFCVTRRKPCWMLCWKLCGMLRWLLGWCSMLESATARRPALTSASSATALVVVVVVVVVAVVGSSSRRAAVVVVVLVMLMFGRLSRCWWCKVSVNRKLHSGATRNTESHLSRRAMCTGSIYCTKIGADSKVCF
jgi:FlaA1/EpsC-like NDP-sugar epimerase